MKRYLLLSECLQSTWEKQIKKDRMGSHAKQLTNKFKKTYFYVREPGTTLALSGSVRRP